MVPPNLMGHMDYILRVNGDFTHSNVKYQLILGFVEKAPASIEEIFTFLQTATVKQDNKDLNLKLSKRALKELYLDKMIMNKEICFLNKTKRPKSYKLILKVAYGKIWNNRKNKYYFYTPRSKKLYRILNEKVNQLKNKKICFELIDNICFRLQALEIISKLQYQEFFNDNVIKAHYNQKRIKFVDVVEKKRKENLFRLIQEFPKMNNIKFRIPKVASTTFNNQKYLSVGKRLVPFVQFIDFLSILTTNLSSLMYWVMVHNLQHNEFLIKNMLRLFLEIEKESQI